MNWQAKKTVKLGNLGEQIVDDYLAQKGVIPICTGRGRRAPL